MSQRCPGGTSLRSHPEAFWKATGTGKVEPAPEGSPAPWDAVHCLERWRFYANSLYDRGHQVRPWLDPEVDMTGRLWRRFLERCRKAGAEIIDDE